MTYMRPRAQHSNNIATIVYKRTENVTDTKPQIIYMIDKTNKRIKLYRDHIKICGNMAVQI